jgi:hypothetical protein
LIVGERKLSRNIDFDFGPRASQSEYFQVFKANAGALGVLPLPFPADIAHLYCRFYAIQENLRTLIQSDWMSLSKTRRLVFVRALMAEISDVVSAGCTLVAKLDEYALTTAHRAGQAMDLAKAPATTAKA